MNDESLARDAVFISSKESSKELNESGLQVNGYDFNKWPIDVHALLGSFATTGFQANHFSKAVNVINSMLEHRIKGTEKEPCTIFLGYTSNMISSGLRDVFRFLVEHKLVDCIVTTAGGIEEDIIKCLGPVYVGDFRMDGSALRDKGLNRIGNLLMPNDNYCSFEDWLLPQLDKLLEEQKAVPGTVWSPSKIIKVLGEAIDDPRSVYYWAAKNDIPVFCPAFTDGSIGDMMYFHSYKNPGLIVDINQDVRKINNLAVHAKNTGMIILGAGVIKHHICNANLMRNGADYAVYLNTAQEYDGSDAGAVPDEAVSWGKIRQGAKSVKVYADATIVFPLLVAETFAKFLHGKR